MPRGSNPASWGHGKSGSAHHRWTAGGSIASNGYVKTRVGKGHPLADRNGYAYEHQVVWCAAGNPRPQKDEIIHHRNGDRTDNRIQNLELMKRSRHNAEHLAIENRRCRKTGRLLKKSGRLLDGVEHNGVPA